ncbi:MAG: aminoacyl-tRNA hydrolase [Spirochaetaceae bacterium 4572_59]|nr:MAG: aminoacyl-tRNA hydrolase [Spirochaetaceae bacterium 4572_59]
MSAQKIDFKLIVLLGNPGSQYEQTRHNASWLCQAYLPSVDSLSWKEKFNGKYCDYGLPGQSIRLLKPETFMNKSGESAGKAATFFKVKPEEILVVHDELELPFGTVQFRKGGGLGGHNGLRSLKQHLGTGDFYRYRLGISRPPHGDVSRWVLSPFSGEEKPLLSVYWERSALILERIIMNKTNRINENEKIAVLDSPV